MHGRNVSDDQPAKESAGSPKVDFARFVRNAIDDCKARDRRSIADIAAESGVGRSTLFRWLAGDWSDYPELAKVRAFCVAADIPLSAAIRTLRLSGRVDPTTVARSTRSQEVDEDIQSLRDILADPHVPAVHKRHIRRALHRLADRSQREVG